MAEQLGHSLSCKIAQRERLALLRGNYHLFGHLGPFQRHSGMEVLHLIPSPGPAQEQQGGLNLTCTSGASCISHVQAQLFSCFSEPKVFRSQ